MSAAIFDDLVSNLAAEPELRAKVDLLLIEIAGRMTAASNDQNVQRLARTLRAAAPTIATAVCVSDGAKKVPA